MQPSMLWPRSFFKKIKTNNEKKDKAMKKIIKETVAKAPLVAKELLIVPIPRKKVKSAMMSSTDSEMN